MFNNPLNKLFAKSKTIHIVAAGAHTLLSDGTIREIKMTPKLADAILGFISHRQGGKINLGQQLEIYVVPPVSKEKDRDYIGIEFQLEAFTIDCEKMNCLTCNRRNATGSF